MEGRELKLYEKKKIFISNVIQKVLENEERREEHVEELLKSWGDSESDISEESLEKEKIKKSSTLGDPTLPTRPRFTVVE